MTIAPLVEKVETALLSDCYANPLRRLLVSEAYIAILAPVIALELLLGKFRHMPRKGTY
jgi:hypothetical protein